MFSIYCYIAGVRVYSLSLYIIQTSFLAFDVAGFLLFGVMLWLVCRTSCRLGQYTLFLLVVSSCCFTFSDNMGLANSPILFRRSGLCHCYLITWRGQSADVGTKIIASHCRSILTLHVLLGPTVQYIHHTIMSINYTVHTYLVDHFILTNS